MSRIRHFDYLRGVAILCVVVMHNTLTYVFSPTEILIDCFLHNLVIVGVPVFFFVAGYFLAFDRESRFTSCIRKKSIRVYLPTVVWTILFWAALSFTGDVRGFDVKALFWNIVTLRDPGHYYFIFVLMILFVGGYWIKGIDVAKMRVIVWFSFVLNLLTILGYEVAIWFVKVISPLGPFMYRNPLAWAFFFVYGLYVSRTDRELAGGWIRYLRERKTIGLAIMVGLWIVTSIETWYLFPRLAPGGQDYFKVASFCYEFLALNYLLIALKGFKGHGLPGSILQVLARYSFFIYLVHIPTVPKLLGVEVLAGMSHFHYPAMILTVALCIVVPLLLAVPVRLLRNCPWVYIPLSRLLGLPV